MGLEASAVGNHEFDKGAAELLRLQRGGCGPADRLQGPGAFQGRAFQYLAASTVNMPDRPDAAAGVSRQALPGHPVAFIGLTLKDTPTIVVPSGVAGLRSATRPRP
jgi:5'-nucleotidase